MAYTLQGLIGKPQVFTQACVEPAGIVQLPQTFGLLPFSTIFLKSHRLPFLPMMDDGALELPKSLLDFCISASSKGQLAYFEAEFFGGRGTQAMAIFDRGAMTSEPLVDAHAINAGLRALGVVRGTAHDEFDALDLGRNRDTDAWLLKI